MTDFVHNKLIVIGDNEPLGKLKALADKGENVAFLSFICPEVKDDFDHIKKMFGVYNIYFLDSPFLNIGICNNLYELTREDSRAYGLDKGACLTLYFTTPWIAPVRLFGFIESLPYCKSLQAFYTDEFVKERIGLFNYTAGIFQGHADFISQIGISVGDSYDEGNDEDEYRHRLLNRNKVENLNIWFGELLRLHDSMQLKLTK